MQKKLVLLLTLMLVGVGVFAATPKGKRSGRKSAASSQTMTVGKYVSKIIGHDGPQITDMATLDAELKWAQGIADGALTQLVKAKYPEATYMGVAGQLAAVNKGVDKYFAGKMDQAMTTMDMAIVAGESSQYARFCELASMNAWLKREDLQNKEALKQFCLQLMIFEYNTASMLAEFFTTQSGGGTMAMATRPFFFEKTYESGATMFDDDINGQLYGQTVAHVTPEAAMAELMANLAPSKLEDMREYAEYSYEEYKKLYDNANPDFAKLLAACRAWTRSQKETVVDDEYGEIAGMDGTALENILTPFILRIAPLAEVEENL